MSKNQATVTLSHKWVTPYNFKRGQGQENNLPSLTTPDRTMSLVELIDKFANGQSFNLGANLSYHGVTDKDGNGMDIDDDILQGQKWDSLDIVEKHQILADAKTDMRKINEGIKINREKLKKLADDEEALRKERNKKFDEWEKLQQKKEA